MQWRDWYGDGSLLVAEIALACCTLEVAAAAPPVSAGEATRPLGAGQRTAVLVSGTVTDRLAPAVLALLQACTDDTGTRPTVISFGACATSGGPYWDSYAVTKGVDQLVPVDVYVPGCPPPPEALDAVFDGLTGRTVA